MTVIADSQVVVPDQLRLDPGRLEPERLLEPQPQPEPLPIPPAEVKRVTMTAACRSVYWSISLIPPCDSGFGAASCRSTQSSIRHE